MLNLPKNTSLTGVSVCIPVYNEKSEIVVKLYNELIVLGAEVIVINDGNTVELPNYVNQIGYTPNQGYGYALKRGIEKATQPLIVTCDGDGQHTFQDILKLRIVFGLITNCDMLVGMRWGLNESRLRYYGRKVLNFIASLFADQYLIDLNSGMRIFKKDVAIQYFPILCNEFSFTTSLTMSLLCDGYKVIYFPIDVQNRSFGKSKVRLVKDGLVTLSYIIWIGGALRTRKLRAWLRKFALWNIIKKPFQWLLSLLT
jgi:glycosyltransferase involved in cell wall biosynthesis